MAQVSHALAGESDAAGPSGVFLGDGWDPVVYGDAARAALASGPFSVMADSAGYAIAKRGFDISVAVLLLVATTPLLLFVAVLVRTTSPGPVIFRQVRIGRGGRPYLCFKFRTMTSGAEQWKQQLLALNEVPGPVFKMQNDPRVTRVGRWLRKFSIDELPQLLNVLAGEMSIVGPRPAVPEEVAQYDSVQRRRLGVKPGLTCLWQVSGRSFIPFEEWVRLDLEYIRRRSFWLDCWLVLRTIPAVILGRGAC